MELIPFIFLIIFHFLWIESVACNKYNVTASFPDEVVGKNRELVALLQQYVSEHNEYVVSQEDDASFCQRKFVLGVYACPQAIGNHMHEFLNSYAAAVILNRTIVWKFCDRKACRLDNEGDCAEVMKRAPWIVSYWRVLDEWNKRRCLNGTSFNPHVLIHHNYRNQAEEVFMCCGLDEYAHPFPIVDIGTHEHHQMLSLALPNARLHPTLKYRAQLLFKEGENFGYGMLFRSVFTVQDYIRKSNDLIFDSIRSKINPSKEPFLLALHLRHSGKTDVEEEALGAMPCVLEILKEHFHRERQHCVLLIASDRNQSFHYWRDHSKIDDFECLIITANHTKSHPAYTEHGPFTGEVAVRDLDLLARADILMGSSYILEGYRSLASTFSMLISELIATNGKEVKNTYYIPFCHFKVAGRRDAKYIFTHPEYDCRKKRLKELFMPDECPYANITHIED